MAGKMLNLEFEMGGFQRAGQVGGRGLYDIMWLGNDSRRRASHGGGRHKIQAVTSSLHE